MAARHDPASRGRTIVERAAAEGVILEPRIENGWLARAAPSLEALTIARALRPSSLIVARLASLKGFLGVVAMISGGLRSYGEPEKRVAEELGRRAAVAIENALLFEEARQKTEKLSRANDAKDEFICLMSHELRTPTTTIFGGMRILRSRADHLTDEEKEGLRADIEVESERLGRMIEDLLILSRVA